MVNDNGDDDDEDDNDSQNNASKTLLAHRTQMHTDNFLGWGDFVRK
jgi:hypothetical protein